MSLVRTVRLRVPAGAARPGPAIGQALGPLGINMAEFCKQFNEKSDQLGYERETPLPVLLSAMSFKFEVKSPPTSYLIKKVTKIEKGPNSPNAEVNSVAFLTPEAVFEIAKIKQKDDMMWHLPLEGIAKSVIGTAKSMGITVREYEEDSA